MAKEILYMHQDELCTLNKQARQVLSTLVSIRIRSIFDFMFHVCQTVMLHQGQCRDGTSRN